MHLNMKKAVTCGLTLTLLACSGGGGGGGSSITPPTGGGGGGGGSSAPNNLSGINAYYGFNSINRTTPFEESLSVPTSTEGLNVINSFYVRINDSVTNNLDLGVFQPDCYFSGSYQLTLVAGPNNAPTYMTSVVYINASLMEWYPQLTFTVRNGSTSAVTHRRIDDAKTSSNGASCNNGLVTFDNGSKAYANSSVMLLKTATGALYFGVNRSTALDYSNPGGSVVRGTSFSSYRSGVTWNSADSASYSYGQPSAETVNCVYTTGDYCLNPTDEASASSDGFSASLGYIRDGQFYSGKRAMVVGTEIGTTTVLVGSSPLTETDRTDIPQYVGGGIQSYYQDLKGVSRFLIQVEH